MPTCENEIQLHNPERLYTDVAKRDATESTEYLYRRVFDGVTNNVANNAFFRDVTLRRPSQMIEREEGQEFRRRSSQMSMRHQRIHGENIVIKVTTKLCNAEP